MRLQDYVAKRGNTKALTSAEASAFGVPWPLVSGWWQMEIEITAQMAAAVVASYESNCKKARAGRARALLAGLRILRDVFPDVVPEVLPSVDAKPANKFVQEMKANKKHKKEKKQKSTGPVVRQQVAYESTDAFLESYEWRRTRMVVLKRDGARCACCGATREHGLRMHVDHIKPRKLFPDLALDVNNLQVLCEVCNHGKGNWDMTDWRKKETA